MIINAFYSDAADQTLSEEIFPIFFTVAGLVKPDMGVVLLRADGTAVEHPQVVVADTCRQMYRSY